MKYLAYLILIGNLVFNLWLNFPETKILADPNDNIFQFGLIQRTNWIWENYGCPQSLSCLPNLVDHLVPAWAEGYPLPFYYSHIPQITTVGSYHLIIRPVTSMFNWQYSLYEYYNLTKYLLLCLIPLTFYFAFVLLGFSPITSSLAALFAAHYSTDGLYGIDPPSYLWRGWGLTSQLYALPFMSLAWVFTYKAVKTVSNDKSQRNNRGNTEGRNLAAFQDTRKTTKIKTFFSKLFSHYTFWAIFLLSATTAGHLGIGIICLLATAPLLFLDFNKTNIILRFKKLFIIYSAFLISLSYWIIPVLLYGNYHMVSFWDPIWKFDSYGWFEVIRQFFMGEIFDWQRPPIVTGLVSLGFFVLLSHPELFPFAVSFVLMFLIYFGRTTWGGLIDLIPGMKDYHIHRFVVGVQMTSLFLLPAAFDWLFEKTNDIFEFFNKRYELEEKMNFSNVKKLAVFLLLAPVIAVMLFFTAKQTVNYAYFNNKWIGEANRAYLHDEKNFKELLNYVYSLPTARIYAGRAGNWGKQFRLGSTELYMLLSIQGLDITQFLPETWSPMSENDQNFDERVAKDYDLLNTRYIVAPEKKDFPPEASLLKKYGPFELYEVPTTGWFDVVTSPMFVKSDKTNFLNLVYLWHRSFARTWKMHPLLSVEKKPDIPAGMKRELKMINEVTYEEGGIKKNIFSDFPLIFPESTPSGKMISENVSKQTYTGVVEIPQKCDQCHILFKMSYHPNWEVKIDGVKAAKQAIFPFYMATPITSGSHTVEYTYLPNKLKVSLIVGEIIFISGLILYSLLRKRLKNK